MAFLPWRLNYLAKMAQCASYSTLLKRTMAFKSAISLETLYPTSSLKLTTPAFTPDPKEKFSGFIPMEKLDITYSASSGPGGQNVNKVHTKVDLRFKVSEADWLHPDIREKMLELSIKSQLLNIGLPIDCLIEGILAIFAKLGKQHGKKLTKDGYLIIRSDTTRSQQLNLADCLQKLRNLIRDAAVTQRQPSPETQERIRQRHLKAARHRVALKREESLKRGLRQPPTVVDL